MLRTEDLRRRSKRRPSEEERPAVERCPVATAAVALAEAVAGEDMETDVGLPAYVITTRSRARREALEGPGVELVTRMSGRADPLTKALRGMLCEESVAPEDLLFLDLETTGLQSTPLFLIGAMTWEDGELVVRQYFARHYGEEPAVLSAFLKQASGPRVLVSFNGKSYDWPYVRMRAAATGVPFHADLAHLDLLHASRRVWGKTLPDCRLQTLEQHVCGCPQRSGDIPGSQIPDAYHEFVRTGDAAKMLKVLEHNLLDLATLARLLVVVSEKWGA